MSRSKGSLLGIGANPWLWGAGLTAGFYYLLQEYGIGGPMGRRIFAGHWVEYVETGMFFIGLSVLLIKALDVLWQLGSLKQTTLGEIPPGGQPVSAVDGLLAQLESGGGYLLHRLRAGLEYVRRRGAADQLDEELKYLADVDAERQNASFGLVRLIIGATPLMGFLGTVIGITLAIADISIEQLMESPESVTAGLSVAFDTTALAIALTIVLLVVQFVVERFEMQLLAAVDVKVTEELSGRFLTTPGDGDNLVAAVRRMSDEILRATQQMVDRQAELWQSTITAAQRRWALEADEQARLVEGAFAKALVGGLEAHAQRMAEAEQAATQQNREHWQGVQQALTEATASVQQQQSELVRQGEVLREVVAATGQVARLEDSLNSNLAALKKTGQFDEVLTSLSAAISLLIARIGSGDGEKQVQLQRKNSEGRAA